MMTKADMVQLIAAMEDLYRLSDGLKKLGITMEYSKYENLWAIEELILENSIFAGLIDTGNDESVDAFYEIMQSKKHTAKQKYNMLKKD